MHSRGRSTHAARGWSTVHPMATRLAMHLWTRRHGRARTTTCRPRRNRRGQRRCQGFDRSVSAPVRGDSGSPGASRTKRRVSHATWARPSRRYHHPPGCWRCSSADPLEVDRHLVAVGRAAVADVSAMTLLEYCRPLVHTASGATSRRCTKRSGVLGLDDLRLRMGSPEVARRQFDRAGPRMRRRRSATSARSANAAGSSWALGSSSVARRSSPRTDRRKSTSVRRSGTWRCPACGWTSLGRTSVRRMVAPAEAAGGRADASAPGARGVRRTRCRRVRGAGILELRASRRAGAQRSPDTILVLTALRPGRRAGPRRVLDRTRACSSSARGPSSTTCTRSS